MSSKMLQPVPETINFPQEEEDILKYWKKINAFEECSKLSKGRPLYSFYDGPPFATGLPHYGHILAGTIKDVVTRYAFQNGFHVERRFGWDCHGLPVEFEIDKMFGFKGPEDVEKFGVANYNKECRKIVMRYSEEWETIVNRIGRWIDFRNDYKTLYPWFMESVWWVFSELWNKGLVYRGVKVMPYSTACNTPLSNFESGQNYKEVVDPAVVPAFQLADDKNTYLLAWTTTPWTLPSNLALCVNPDLMYVTLKATTIATQYVLMESRVSEFFKNEGDGIYSAKIDTKTVEFKVTSRYPGRELAGKKYVPLLPYFSKAVSKGFVVLTDSYVTEDSGTGIVHQAPYFGEDDYRICLKNGIITKDQEPICPIDASGKFTAPVTDFIGQYVKDADKEIIKRLKSESKIFRVGTVTHNYPFCWRSETPLIYRAVPSWFIRVQHMSENLLKCNDSTYWVPEFVKEKRFGNWLKDARDWAVSRNRYWGTPIPLWVSDDFEEIVCVSSIKELETLTGSKIDDLHRDSIDHLTIPSKREGKAPLRRVPEVFDCWFESGSMPYAQLHYPFENVAEFEKKFPADFIAEGIDQTRGWFYTLLVISTALFNKAPFKNLIVNGLVLASDGQKMSKSKRNFPDPNEVINKFGADALRLYLINSPVVRADKLRFREDGVRDVLKDVFLPWYNAYRFLMQNIVNIKSETGVDIRFNDDEFEPDNLMDKWILSFTQSLNVFVRREMAAYRLYTVVPRLVEFIDNLTNWYVKMNRRRLKGDNGFDDCKSALCTLGCVLSSMVRLMAPYTPFLTEKIFENLKVLTNREEKSIHFVQMPQPRSDLIDEKIEQAVSKMQTVIDLGRVIRDRNTLPLKFPLKEIIVILENKLSVQQLIPLQSYIMEELNVKKVHLSTDKNAYGVCFRAEPDHKTLGPRLKDKFKPIAEAIKNLNDDEIMKYKKLGKIVIQGETLTEGELRVMLTFEGEAAAELTQKYSTNVHNDVLVLLDITPDETMMAEGTAREIVNRVQKLRKKAQLLPTDKIDVFCTVYPPNSNLAQIASDFSEYISNSLKVPFLIGYPDLRAITIIEDDQELKSSEKGVTLHITVTEPFRDTGEPCPPPPFCRYVNVSLVDSNQPQAANCSILLENPVGYHQITLSELKFQIKNIYSLFGREIDITVNGSELLTDEQLANFSGNIVATVVGSPPVPPGKLRIQKGILSRFINISYGQIRATILLENPVGNNLPLNRDAIKRRAQKLMSSVVQMPRKDDITYYQ